MEENKEEVVEETTQEQPKVEKPKIDESKFQSAGDNNVYKVDLTKKEETDAVQEQSTDEVPVQNEPEASKEVVEEIIETTDEKSSGENSVQNETPPNVEEIAKEASKAIEESVETGKPLPESIEKLVNFIEETGGDLNDYVKLNQDYSELDNLSLLEEYYKQTKPHLNSEEIGFLMNDQFDYNEDKDDEVEIKRKKLALKEQVADARQHLDGLKSKYYEDIKAGSKLTEDQQKAINFFNRHKQEEAENQKGAEQRNSVFQEKTSNVFNDKFKGFEFNVGEKKFRYNVQDANKVKESQSDISNFIGKFLDENNTMKDAEGYHKSLFTAMNPDAVAKHFYEQGQADALKKSVEKGKNINMNPRQSHGQTEAGGLKFKVLGDNSADFKFKIKNNK